MRLQRFGPSLEDKVGSDRSAGQLVAGDPETGDASSDQNRAALPETLPYNSKVAYHTGRGGKVHTLRGESSAQAGSASDVTRCQALPCREVASGPHPVDDEACRHASRGHSELWVRMRARMLCVWNIVRCSLDFAARIRSAQDFRDGPGSLKVNLHRSNLGCHQRQLGRKHLIESS